MKSRPVDALIDVTKDLDVTTSFSVSHLNFWVNSIDSPRLYKLAHKHELSAAFPSCRIPLPLLLEPHPKSPSPLDICLARRTFCLHGQGLLQGSVSLSNNDASFLRSLAGRSQQPAMASIPWISRILLRPCNYAVASPNHLGKGGRRCHPYLERTVLGRVDSRLDQVHRAHAGPHDGPQRQR